VVPGASAPGKLAGAGEAPVTVRVKSPAVAVRPWSLMTCLITTSCGGMSSLTISQVALPPIGMARFEQLE
jgi:hypothetical protein